VSGSSLLQAALAGPTLAALAWLALVRWPLARRVVAGVIAIGALAAASAVLSLAYRGDDVAWRSFQPGLLGATILVIAELGMLLVALRAETVPRGGNAAAIAGLGISASAIAAMAYAGSLAVVALALPIPSVAAAGAALMGRGREDARGLIGLAAADTVALIGLSLVFARTGSIIVGEAGGAGPLLLLFSALAKAGAVPGLATWRLSATGGPGAWLGAALRGQALVLAALAALTMRSSATVSGLAIVAAVAGLIGGGIALLSRRREATVTAAVGTAAGVLFLALGLGGAVGSRAFLLLFPAFVLATVVVEILGHDDPVEERSKKPAAAGPWGWLSACALGVGMGSLLGLPPGGGFPGTWLGISLAGARSEVSLGWLFVAGATAVGLAIAMLASVSLIRAARPNLFPALAGSVVGLGLLYIGTQPIRLALGWWVRVETALRLPEVLPSAGAPGLPAIGGQRLALALAPAVVLVALAIGLGRGVRDVSVEFSPALAPADPKKRPAVLARLHGLREWAAAAAKPVTELLTRARAIGVGFGIAAVLELSALLLAGRIVLLSARAGFL
jgi:hypothetical protein